MEKVASEVFLKIMCKGVGGGPSSWYRSLRAEQIELLPVTSMTECKFYSNHYFLILLKPHFLH